MRRVDAAIIGGSLAGATCARELTRMGVEAAAFDRDAFPREKVCGGFLSPGAVRMLGSLGMIDAVLGEGAMDVRAARIRLPGVELKFDLPRPGLGISRRALDAVFANHNAIERGTVRSVNAEGGGFRIGLDHEEIQARIVVDAAGKLSRFSERESSNEFGVQFYEPHWEEGILDFWFFSDGYGGSVGVEGRRTNSCFLINKEALPRYVSKPGCLVTGPVAYDSRPTKWIAVGDAAGMIDPFCGEGIRHALDTGRLAAEVVSQGLRDGRTYLEMKRLYAVRRRRAWAGKRALGRWIRRAVRHPEILRRALTARPEWFVAHLWA